MSKQDAFGMGATLGRGADSESAQTQHPRAPRDAREDDQILSGTGAAGAAPNAGAAVAAGAAPKAGAATPPPAAAAV